MYTTLSNKSNAFKHSVINTVDELESTILNLEAQPNLRFRGVNEAKYKMMTSLQRMCPSKELTKQKDYLTGLLSKVRDSSSVINFFNNNKISINDLSCLSLMQHYGLPTPLLDFSTDIKIALSFAAHEMKTPSGLEDIDNYASLYAFDTKAEYEVGIPIQQIMNNDEYKGERYESQHSESNVNDSLLQKIDKFIQWNDLADIELVFIEYQQFAPGFITLSGQGLNLSNPNLDMQKGCFLLNLYGGEIPLEENWNMRTKESRDQFWSNPNSDTKFNCKGMHTKEKLTCYDIKKDILSDWARINAIPLFNKNPESQCVENQLLKIKETLKTSL